MYRPPALTKRVVVRDPALRPAAIYDRYGRPVGIVAEYGVTVWASRRDRRVINELADGVEVRGSETVFTIRDRDLPADFSVLHAGIEYHSRGAPIRRGGPEGGMRNWYLELWTERRQRAAA